MEDYYVQNEILKSSLLLLGIVDQLEKETRNREIRDQFLFYLENKGELSYIVYIYMAVICIIVY